ncbi:28S ribosomal protein S5, mitochondrial [Collichthys lucidus]|uniref:Small ribosomal subunit protein uS5m n=1 Tax=Collichthys lucidus TaxID=240159 RepID=A0A4U5VCY0_COLLU|nr:28S ribosomal protein S5, mitochondrial [Collichthys lucidus]
MAACIRVCCALRLTVSAPLRTFGGAVQASQLASRPSAASSLQRNPALLPLCPATAWQQTRNGSFFNKCAGARKGRGKRTKRKLKRDLNRGQSIGEVRQRDEWERKRKMKVKRERGWTGRSWGGISLGPPDPGPNGETYEGFDSRVIEVKTVFNMTAKEGRKRSISCLVAVGNGNGAAGFALGKAAERNTALRKAKNRAIHYLYYIERYNDSTILLSTVYHDIESKFKRTTLRMKKQNKGYGLHCHRAVITLCKLIGIKDMYCKVEGSVNLLNITRALFTGLATQETHQALADKKQLHVVEFQAQRGPLPVVVASPKDGAQTDPEPEDEIPNTRLHWSDVQAAQGTKRSIWAGVKRTIW